MSKDPYARMFLFRRTMQVIERYASCVGKMLAKRPRQVAEIKEAEWQQQKR